MRKGLTAIEVVVASSAILLLIGLAIPLMGTHTHCSAGGKESVNLRNIQMAMATYASANKGYFPGLTSKGDYMSKPLAGKYYSVSANAGSVAEEKSGDGCFISTGNNSALACLLEDGAVTPAQLVSPGETNPGIVEVAPASAGGSTGEVRDNHFSFAMLAYGRKSLKTEWTYTTNPQAIVLATRLMFGAKTGVYSSVWTPPGSSQWLGWTVRNDGSTQWARRNWYGGRSYDFESCSTGSMEAFASLKYGALAPFNATTESTTTVGIFGRSTDMKNFDATPSTGMVGSVND